MGIMFGSADLSRLVFGYVLAGLGRVVVRLELQGRGSLRPSRSTNQAGRLPLPAVPLTRHIDVNYPKSILTDRKLSF